ncbi:EFR1 family ferrodoxin [Clostridium sp. 'White wine YQ']|uniref:EFR1 family ferrodoxin n=1 Tax=Clostridium sp. 'White wine YQ' TaxID=3027474 RepID=UPI0023671101|nr:EFR1 family ferrodoxin [Clostridium sp. 'White wine YQ']MDD7793416.1 EFR1 family ferrodoxin [Clostridium sp. 'White wine YQ']
MEITKDTIFYFSGSGNSLQIAKDIFSRLGEFNLINIGSLLNEKKIEVKARTIGIIFPVYYARMPLIVENVAKKLKISIDTYVFGIASHGGAPANVLIRLDDKLKENGLGLNSGFLIHMPANNVLAYNPKTPEKHNKTFEREKEKVEKISAIIRERKSQKCEVSKLVIDRGIDKLFSKATNKIMNKLHEKDSEFWAKNNCNSCRICEKICPVNNIELKNNKPIWKHKCEQCTACIQYCPEKAIQFGTKTINRNRYRNPNVSLNEMIIKTQ